MSSSDPTVCRLFILKKSCIAANDDNDRVLCTGSGFAITKLDIFPAVASRGAGQIVLQIGLPCLLFSKIIPAFSSENLSSLGKSGLAIVFMDGG